MKNTFFYKCIKKLFSEFKEKGMYFVVFSISFLARLTVLSIDTITMRVQYDDIGMLVYPAFLAGFNWTEIASYCSYYGGGYMILFTPILKFVESPQMIWELILIGHIIVISLGCLLAYFFAVKYLELPRNMLTVLQCVASSLIIETPTTMTNEPMLFLITWIIIILFYQWHFSKKKKHYVIGMFFLALISGYALLVHTRAIVFPVVLTLLLLISCLKYRTTKSFLSLVIFCIFIVIEYILYDRIKSGAANLLYLADKKELYNTSLIVGSAPFSKIFSLKGIKVCFDLLIGNLWRLSSLTCGLSCVSISMIPLIFKRMIKEQKDEYAFWFSFLCGFLGLAGVVATYARYVIDYYPYLADNYGAKGFFYTRYFATFLGPLLLVTFKEIYIKTSKNRTIGLASLVLTLFLFLYFKYIIFPMIEGGLNENSSSMEYFGFDSNNSFLNFKIALLIQLVCIFLIFFIKKKYLAELCILFILIKPWSIVGKEFGFNILLNENADGGYVVYNAVLKNAEDIEYYAVSPLKARVYQYYLKKEIIHVGYPDSNKKCVIFSNAENDERLIELGYECLMIDDNEYLWTDDYNIIVELNEKGLVSEKDL